MLKEYNIAEIYSLLIEYIEHNKVKIGINYLHSVQVLEELLEQIKEEYINIE